ncbi:hypothetical protein [Pontibacter chinhatensis]|uniref:Uncharacterized protein n=1 Tax=Pontibacter chinhatensis TaxID=1436961 RepID=A0A1I2TY69_9BACT|nr:hypothetical protein [Pontibacter chinhatensis]SFG69838.1 hypothetical protein SAMN05421739_103325 [Pontibacter chinhatensis]
MNKNVTAVFAAVCGLFMASCGTPSDLRPGEKVSTDIVEPGTRKTFNVSDAGTIEGDAVVDQAKKDEVMPNHDQGANTLQAGDSVREEAETNTEAGAVKR